MTIQHNGPHKFIKAASACVWRGDEILLVQRASALGRGRWNLPGGKWEVGETLLEAAHRELLEETAVSASLTVHVGDFTIMLPDVAYVISCFTGAYVHGEATAGSDAGAVVWTPWTSISQFNLAPNIEDAIQRAHKLLSV
jgi:8-oxo-dGTP diphosphatase